MPLEANELRPAKSDANSAVVTDFASRKVDRASQQQAITKPVIVTPEKIADSDFSAEPLRPFSEPAGVQLTRAGNLAPETDSAKDFALRNEASKRNEPQPPADDNSFSHEGSQIASQVLTPDLSSNLTDNDPDPVAGQSQAARQTSFDSEPLRSRQLADDRNGVPGLDKPSTNVPAQTISTNETEQENPRKHLVLAGESFWSIAQSHYDDGRFFRALYEYNKQLVGSFENLVPGSTLATPPKTELARLWPELCPEVKDSELVSTNIEDRIYVTRQGDTLFEIARQRLEQASRYLEIQQLNQTRLPDGINHLTPLPAGIQLVLPLDISQ
jgi:nucleoid-associated protein YgaU